MRTSLLVVLALPACLPAFESIEEACPDKVPGEAHVEADAVEVFRRIGCYRRFVHATPARVDPAISEAAHAHALYVQQNGPESNPLLEDPSKPAYTGQTPLDRIEAQGYDFGTADFTTSIGFWEGVFLTDASFDPSAIADGWMWGHFTRQGILQPAWRDGGYGTTDSFAVITILYDFPANEASRRPITWPRDGQTDVPTTWVYEYPDGVFSLFTEVGYPITFTVGSDVSDSAIESANPYDLVLVDSTIDGPDGEVDHVVVTPDTTPYDFPYTVALIPDSPLAPGETYTATARLRWNSRDTTGEFTTTFETAD